MKQEDAGCYEESTNPVKNLYSLAESRIRAKKMQRVSGVRCYCCGEELGSNPRCGDRATTSALRKRPPCLWAHADPIIVQRCTRQAGLKEAKEGHIMIPNGTQVFIPPFIGGHGLRGVVVGWSAGFKQYTIQFDGRSTVGSVPVGMVLRYIDKLNISLYPSNALPFDSSVRCFLDEKLRSGNGNIETVCGIIQGVAVDDSNHPIYYDVGRNMTPKQFFLAADVSVVAPEGSVKVAEASSQAPAPEVQQIHEVQLIDSSSSSSDFERKPAVKRPAQPKKVATKKTVAPSMKAAAPPPAASETTAPRDAAGDAPTAPPPAAAAAKPPKVVSASETTAPRDAAGDAPTAPPPAARKTLAHSFLQTPASSSSEEGSSSDHSDSDGSQAAPKRTATVTKSGSGRKRAVKFNFDHDDDETLVIFRQLATNIPWLHTRRSQKVIWKHHLEQLQNEGHALELAGHKDAIKTFSSWAAHICKTRRTSRLAQMRKSGAATFEHDAVDDVGYRWEMKVCGDGEDSQLNQQRAHLMRDVATATAVSLEAAAAKIEAARSKRYSTKANVTPSKSATPVSNASPVDNARTVILRQLTDLTKQSAEQEEKDARLVTQIVAGMAAQFGQAPAPSSEPSDGTSGDVLLLSNFLRVQDSSLVTWAPRIYAALGITEGAHFKELTEHDINTAAGLPVLQRKRLLAVGKRFDLQQ